MILEAFVPHFQFSERHHIMTNASPSRLFHSIKSLDLSHSPVVRHLYRLRRMPKSALTLGGMAEIGFQTLGEVENQELVIGVIGRLWRPIPQVLDVPRKSFSAFTEPGYAKAAFNFKIEDTGSGNRLSTETRVCCTSRRALAAFSLYWAIIRPFSGLVRRAMLAEIQRTATQWVT